AGGQSATKGIAQRYLNGHGSRIPRRAQNWTNPDGVDPRAVVGLQRDILPDAQRDQARAPVPPVGEAGLPQPYLIGPPYLALIVRLRRRVINDDHKLIGRIRA